MNIENRLQMTNEHPNQEWYSGVISYIFYTFEIMGDTIIVCDLKNIA